jgi:hypothetical protein
MKPVKVADTETLKDLNAVSIEQSPGVCLSDECIADLVPDELHAGVVAGVSKDERHALVAWMPAVKDTNWRPVLQMSLPIEAVNRLPDGELSDDAVGYCIKETRKFLAEMEEEETFWQQGLAEIERLTGEDRDS